MGGTPLDSYRSVHLLLSLSGCFRVLNWLAFEIHLFGLSTPLTAVFSTKVQNWHIIIPTKSPKRAVCLGRLYLRSSTKTKFTSLYLWEYESCNALWITWMYGEPMDTWQHRDWPNRWCLECIDFVYWLWIDFLYLRLQLSRILFEFLESNDQGWKIKWLCVASNQFGTTC